MENLENIGKLCLCFSVPDVTGKPVGVAVEFTKLEVEKYDERTLKAAIDKHMNSLK